MLLLIVPLMISCSSYWEKKNFVDPGYQSKFEYPSALEKRYAMNGMYEVDSICRPDTAECIKQISVWYPVTKSDTPRKWPLVIMANGTGVVASKYEAIFEHLASWGFIVAGNEDENSLLGISTSKTLEYMLSQNDDTDSPLYQMIDTASIGLVGHSQGALAVVVTMKYYENAKRYKAICLQSGGVAEGASAIKVPTLMMAGTGNADSKFLCPLAAMNEHFDSISAAPVVVGRIKDIDHGDVLKKGDAYMTAWMCCWLKGDKEAEKCFSGENAEILTNPSWQDVRRKNLLNIIH